MLRPQKKKRRLSVRRKRTLDPNLVIDYKKPDLLKRFITDRGKIIPRRISGATAKQQRHICRAIKRARFLSLIPFSSAHLHERGFSGEMATVLSAASSFSQGYRPKFDPQKAAAAGIDTAKTAALANTEVDEDDEDEEEGEDEKDDKE